MDLIAMTLPALLDQLVQRRPEQPILCWRDRVMTARDLQHEVRQLAVTFENLGLEPGDRIAIWLPKQCEAVVAIWAASQAGAIFIPVNPALKPAQVLHILNDSQCRLLVSSRERLRQLEALPAACQTLAIEDLPAAGESHAECRAHDTNALAAILYTSGSTGKPKGVMLSHANLTLGAASVAAYLKLTPDDRILCVLPLSFDYGLNQVTTAILTGAQAVLFDHLFAKDVITAMAKYKITGLAGVPALWSQLAPLTWPDAATHNLRYITNSGGRMPKPVLDQLVAKLETREIYLMYGLTEAFRSTYLDPALVAAHPDSVGKAIPCAEVRIVRPDGTETLPDEIGELVHMGPLVAQGYWRDAARTSERFRPAPSCALEPGRPAVWSGDKARRDASGLIYFVGRDDEMIKSSGYRISPTEIEEVLYAVAGVADVVVMGVADERLGEVIVAVVGPGSGQTLDSAVLIDQCRQMLPTYMVPTRIIMRPELPRNANGKLDRSGIHEAVRQGIWR